ncbi:MAG: DUF4158 domain-containing protein [Flavobacteriales bacterium]|nr:DUF4158 domain-containing protein [Flavobacteriales bacterium]
MENIKRIHLMSEAEIEELYSLPDFSTNEQRLYFTLNEFKRIALNRYSNTKTRVYFILQLGYFKAKQQFFSFDFNDVFDDTQFILGTYYNGTELASSGRISRVSAQIQKQDILRRA